MTQYFTRDLRVKSLTVTSSLVVSGTAAVTGNVTISGDLAVNGGDLTTSQTTFNLLNATATTINFGSAATTMRIGAAEVNIGIGTGSHGDATLAVLADSSGAFALTCVGRSSDNISVLRGVNNGVTTEYGSIGFGPSVAGGTSHGVSIGGNFCVIAGAGIAVGKFTTGTTTPATTWGLDISGNTSYTIANNAILTLASGSGLLTVYESTGAGACYNWLVFGSVVQTNISGTLFTTTKDTANKINIYYDAGGSNNYTIQNKTGASVTLHIGTMMARNTN